MLKLIFDVKCGYENEFIIVKDYEFDISFLAKRSFYNKLALISGTEAETNIPTENELFVSYQKDPEELVRDYGLGTVILSLASAEIGAKHFKEIADPKTAPIIFPEIFTVRNFSLVISDEEPKKDNRSAALGTILNLFKQDQDIEDGLTKDISEDNNSDDEESNYNKDFDA